MARSLLIAMLLCGALARGLRRLRQRLGRLQGALHRRRRQALREPRRPREGVVATADTPAALLRRASAFRELTRELSAGLAEARAGRRRRRDAHPGRCGAARHDRAQPEGPREANRGRPARTDPGVAAAPRARLQPHGHGAPADARPRPGPADARLRLQELRPHRLNGDLAPSRSGPDVTTAGPRPRRLRATRPAASVDGARLGAGGALRVDSHPLFDLVLNP